MKIYAVQRGSELLPVAYLDAATAQRMCEDREGCSGVTWKQHDGHGRCWCWGIYTISELDLEPDFESGADVLKVTDGDGSGSLKA